MSLPIDDDIIYKGTLLDTLFGGGGGTSFDKMVIVKTLADLPPLSGGKYTLLSGFSYWIDATLLNLGTDYIELPTGGACQIRSASAQLTTILYSGTGGAIRGVDCQMTMLNITISAPKIFDLTNNAKTKNIVVQSCQFANQTSQSTIVDHAVVLFQLANWGGNAGCYNIDGANEIFIINNYFASTNTGTLVTLTPTTSTDIVISQNHFESNIGDTALNITTTDIGKGIITGNQFIGDGTQLSGVNGNTPNWQIIKDNNQGIAGLFQGYLALLLNTTTSNTTQPTYTPTGGTRLLLDADKYTDLGTVVDVRLNVAVTHSNSSNRLVYVNLYNRTTATFVAGAAFTVTIPTADQVVIAEGPLLSLTTGQVYEVLIARDSSAGNPSVTIYNAEFNLKAY